jgi:hypothetical protein
MTKNKKEEEKKRKASDEENKDKNNKDSMFTIFHALGKFLYNKSKYNLLNNII